MSDQSYSKCATKHNWLYALENRLLLVTMNHNHKRDGNVKYTRFLLSTLKPTTTTTREARERVSRIFL